MREFKCCAKHEDYLVPLIPTFKWRGKEWLCPYCDNKFTYFCKSVYIKASDELIHRNNKYIEAVSAYLQGTQEFNPVKNIKIENNDQAEEEEM